MDTLYFSEEEGRAYLVPSAIRLPLGTLTLVAAGTGAELHVDAAAALPYRADAAAVNLYGDLLSQQVTAVFAETLNRAQAALAARESLPPSQRPQGPQEIQQFLLESLARGVPAAHANLIRQLSPDTENVDDADVAALRSLLMTQIGQSVVPSGIAVFQPLPHDAETQRLVGLLKQTIEQSEAEPEVTSKKSHDTSAELPAELQIDVNYILGAFDAE